MTDFGLPPESAVTIGPLAHRRRLHARIHRIETAGQGLRPLFWAEIDVWKSPRQYSFIEIEYNRDLKPLKNVLSGVKLGPELRNWS